MHDISEPSDGAVTGGVRSLLRAEGAVLFLAPTLSYAVSDAPWQLYVVLFFVPDLGLLGYLLGPRTGAVAYNALHSTLGPLLLALGGLMALEPGVAPVAMIWLAHIGFDRMLGYGLKYGRGFGFSHLGRVGKASAPVVAPPLDSSPAKAA